MPSSDHSENSPEERLEIQSLVLMAQTGYFTAPDCPRCGSRASGRMQVGKGMVVDFESYSIMCGRCYRRSGECAAPLSGSPDPDDEHYIPPERQQSYREAAVRKCLESWALPQPADAEWVAPETSQESQPAPAVDVHQSMSLTQRFLRLLGVK